MWDACRKAFLILPALIAVAIGSRAQDYPNGLSTDSLDPVGDSLFFKEMRAHMDSIRRNCGRPTVALVLSGGGAKGTAHIGAKKFLDEMGIPIDFICGTSMGGLMGGLMALGHSTEYIDSLLKSQDWGTTLTDRVDPRFIPYETKVYKSKYLLSIPFHYMKEDFVNRMHEQERYTDRNSDKPHISDTGENQDYDDNTLASSLPEGYVYGFNVNNFLSSFSVGYQDSVSFRKLPIPFCCVASDMVSLKAKNFSSGSIKTAMRSTMSIPGMFNPVRTQGMILVDGGTRNNFPVDIAIAAGADIIIGFELPNSKTSYSQINNAGDLVSQFIAMLGTDAYQKNISRCDVLIRPDIEGFGMLSFSPQAIDTLMARGYKAALLQKDKLAEIKARMPDAGPYLNTEKAIDVNSRPVQVGFIGFKGLSDNESLLLMRKIGLKVGDYFDKEALDAAMSKLQSTGAFESVTYSLLGTSEPYRLVFDCSKGPVHQIGLGFRADSEERVALALNIGLNAHKLTGFTFDINGKLGTSCSADLRISFDTPHFPTVNLESKVSGIQGMIYTSPHSGGAKQSPLLLKYFYNTETFYISNIQWTKLDLQAGLKYTFLNSHNTWLPDKLDIGQVPAELTRSNYFSSFLKGKYYSFNNKYYPTKGANIDLRYDLYFSRLHNPAFKPVHTASFDARFVINAGERFAIIPDLHVRGVMDTNAFVNEDNELTDAYSLSYRNYIGGNMQGRYFDQQMSFPGFNYVYLAKDFLASANIDFRFSPFKNLYISAIGGFFAETDFFGTFLEAGDTYFGGALELAYNTIIGPVKANIHYSDFTHRAEGYFSLGFDF